MVLMIHLTTKPSLLLWFPCLSVVDLLGVIWSCSWQVLLDNCEDGLEPIYPRPSVPVHWHPSWQPLWISAHGLDAQQSSRFIMSFVEGIFFMQEVTLGRNFVKKNSFQHFVKEWGPNSPWILMDMVMHSPCDITEWWWMSWGVSISSSDSRIYRQKLIIYPRYIIYFIYPRYVIL